MTAQLATAPVVGGGYPVGEVRGAVHRENLLEQPLAAAAGHQEFAEGDSLFTAHREAGVFIRHDAHLHLHPDRVEAVPRPDARLDRDRNVPSSSGRRSLPGPA